jgi:hypothetical protein
MPTMNLLYGPDANFYRLVAFVTMLLAIGVTAISIFSFVFGRVTVGVLPRPVELIGTSLACLSAIGLVIGFAQSKSHRMQIAVLTLCCAAIIPCFTLYVAATWNVMVFLLSVPGLFLSVLSLVIQLRKREVTPCPQ